MICQNIRLRNFLWVVNIIRAQEVLTMQSGKATGYSKAWLHHKGRNKHHYEYWIDYSVDPSEGIVGLKMPGKYVIEMFMDRIAASKTYMGKDYSDQHPLQYYERGAARLGKMIHPETAALLHRLLLMLAEKGEEATFRFIREHKRSLRREESEIKSSKISQENKFEKI